MKKIYRTSKKILAFVAALIVLISTSSVRASTLRTAPVGNAEELFSAISVYCNRWHSLIGEALGFDMSFNPDNIRMTDKKHYNMGGIEVTTFDMDGISVDVSDDLSVYEVQIPIKSGQREQYSSTARIFALISALAYDFPSSEQEMSNRYMTLLSEYLDFMEQNKGALASGDIAYWEIETEKGEFEFQFIAEEGRLMMLYDQMYFADEP